MTIDHTGDAVTTNEALHEGTAKVFEMGGKVMGYAGNRIVRDIATDIALGKLGKVVGKTPRIGVALQTGIGVIDQNRKFYDLYDDFNNLPEDARKIGKDLSWIGQSSRKRRTP